MPPAARASLAALLVLAALAPAVAADRGLRAALKQEAPVAALAFTADGQSLVTADQDGAVQVWDVATGTETRQFRVEGDGLLHFAFAPGATTLVASTTNGRLAVYDVSAGKKIAAAPNVYPSALALAADGHTVALGFPDGTVQFWDITESAVPTAPRLEDGAGRITSLSFTSDGQLLVSGVRVAHGERTATPPQVRLWSAERRRPLRPCKHAAAQVLFAPDGKVLAAWSHDLYAPTLHLLETSTGQDRVVLTGVMAAAAFAPDGRFLAVADGLDAGLHIHDVLAGKEVLALEGHEVAPHLLAFSPDGQTLASGSREFLVHLWDVSRLADKRALRPLQLSAAEREARWEQLGGSDARLAHEAIGVLSRAAELEAEFLRERIDRAVAKLDPTRVAKLIAALDSDNFTERQKATQGLEALGDTAAAGLEKALEGNPALETRRRLEQLLKRIERGAVPPDQVRLLRAVELLERLGTPDARTLLARLAAEKPPSPWSLDATAALARLKRQDGRP